MPAKKASKKAKGKKKGFGALEQELEDTGLVKMKKGGKSKTKTSETSESQKKMMEKVVKFTNIARRQYGDAVKSVLIFGSAARNKMKKTSDVDIWIVLDDTATKSTSDFNRITLNLQLVAKEMKDLHIQTTKLTEFWKWMKMGSPELVNFLRYSLPVYDTGFIKPVKRMLEMGLLPPSEETIKLKAHAAKTRMKKIEIDIKSLVFELRYAALDACQAVAMHHYKEQPDARGVPAMLKKLAKDGKLEAKYVKKFSELNKLWKDIDHKKIENIDGKYLDEALTLSQDIVERMRKLLPKDIRGEDK